MSEGINKKKREKYGICSGHKVHMKCYEEFLDRANHLCPLCKQNVVNIIKIETGEEKKAKMVCFDEFLDGNPFQKKIIFCTQDLRSLFYNFYTGKIPYYRLDKVESFLKIQIYGVIIE